MVSTLDKKLSCQERRPQNVAFERLDSMSHALQARFVKEGGGSQSMKQPEFASDRIKRGIDACGRADLSLSMVVVRPDLRSK